MDSDSENLLVIDESRRPETPVADSERDKANYSKENKENREISQTLSVPGPSSVSLNTSTKEREKEHRPKSESHKSHKSKEDRKGEKRDGVEKKKYAFRLTHLKDFKKKMLKVSS